MKNCRRLSVIIFLVFFVPSWIVLSLDIALAGQPYLVSDRSPGLIWRIEDANGDNDALDTGERTLWGDGLADVVEMEVLGRAVYAVEDGLPTGTNKVYRFEDLNADGDALDVGEQKVWASGLTSPRGITRDDEGKWFVADLEDDNVIKLVDLNQDGDVLDVGEKTLYAEGIDQAISPLWIDGRLLVTAFIGDAVYGLTDLNGDGDALDVGENLVVTPTINEPLGMLADGSSGFFFSSRANDAVYHAEDRNGDGDFLDVAEVLNHADSVYGGIDGSWGMAAYQGGGFLLADNGDGQVVWVDDQTGDGDALDIGEVTLFTDGIDEPIDIVPLLSILAADFDEDGDVDSDDLAQWESDFGLNGDSDADSDNDSDGADFLSWQRQLGSGIPSLTSSQAVPEPSSFVLLSGLATFGMLARRGPSAV